MGYQADIARAFLREVGPDALVDTAVVSLPVDLYQNLVDITRRAIAISQIHQSKREGNSTKTNKKQTLHHVTL